MLFIQQERLIIFPCVFMLSLTGQSRKESEHSEKQPATARVGKMQGLFLNAKSLWQLWTLAIGIGAPSGCYSIFWAIEIFP